MIEIAAIEADKEKEKLLQEIFAFNIAGRYEDAKLAFYKEYNSRETAEKWINHTKDLLKWLNEKSQKK